MKKKGRSNKIVPTEGRGKKRKAKSTDKNISFDSAKRCFFGATYLLDAIGKKLGIADAKASALIVYAFINKYAFI